MQRNTSMDNKQGRNYLTFVVYGNNPTYYQGAYFGILSFLANWVGDESSRPNIVVLTEDSDWFTGLPIQVFTITPEQKNDWSMGGDYHFRIKNRGLRYICDQVSLNTNDKLLFLDADTYFDKPTNVFFDLINSQRSVMYCSEVNINKLPEDNEYAIIRNKEIILSDNKVYRVNESSVMWASAIIGIMGNHIDSLDFADDLIIALRKIGCNAHTLEQFTLSEALAEVCSIVAGKPWLNHYSTSGRKDWAKQVLSDFFDNYSDCSFEQQINRSRSISFKRPLFEIIRGHIYKKRKKIQKLFKK